MAKEVFQRTIDVTAPSAVAWNTLTDVDRVASWVSVVGGVAELERLQRYTAVLEDRIGPFVLRADLDVSVTSLDEGRSIAFRADGEDRQVSSRITIEAELTLDESAGGVTLAVTGSYEVGGRVAAIGGSTVRSKATKILDEFFAAADRELNE